MIVKSSKSERRISLGDLSIEWKPSGRSDTATLTARLNGKPIAFESVNLAKEKVRADFAHQLCKDRSGIDMEAVKALLLQIATELKSTGTDSDDAESAPTLSELLAEMPETARQEAHAMLQDPNLAKRVIDDVANLGVAGERELILTIYLVGVSRLLPKPLAAIVQGLTSSGKSYVEEQVATLFPPETVLRATQQTPQALFYMTPGTLKHRFVVAGERSRAEEDEAAEATRALREMLSSGRLSKLVATRVGGQMRTRHVEQDGPIAFVETTTMTNIFDEDANRCILLTTDEREDQSRRIITKLARDYSGEAFVGDSTRIIDRHHAVQRVLEGKPVVIPYAERLGELFDSKRVEARRAFPQLMSMIQASALLHQFQRQIDSVGRVLATQDDYQLARHLLVKPFARLLKGGPSDSALRFFERLQAWAGEAEFTTTEAHRHESASRRAVTGWLSELAEVGVVEQLDPGKGSRPAVWRLTGQRRMPFRPAP